jgi:hypothetical protein
LKIKTVDVNGTTYAALLDGKPVYVHDDGKEVAFDAVTTVATISRLNSEAKGHREAKEAAESKLKAFEGIEDAEGARKALETVKNLKDGDLVTAGKAEEIKKAAVRAAEEQVAAAKKAADERVKELEAINAKVTNELYSEKVGGAFTRSSFVKEKVTTPPAMLQDSFGKHFKVEDGKTVGYDASGNKIYSRARPGEIADFDEALEMLIDAYPYRDDILKGAGHKGTGARESNGNGTGGKTLTRAEFDAKSPTEKAALSKEITARTLTVVD